MEAIARHPNGQWLLCGGIDFLSTSGTTGAVCVWDLNVKKRMQSLPHGATCVAFDGNGSRFAFATPDGRVMVAAPESAEILMELDGPEDIEMTALIFSPDGAWLLGASEDATLRAWDLSTGELLALRQVATTVHSFAASPTGRLFTGNANTTCYELALPQMTELP